MAPPNKVRAHFFDERQFAPDQIFGHGRAQTCMVLVTLRAAQQQSLAVEFERSLFYKFKRAQAKPFARLVFTVRAFERNYTAIERRTVNGPDARFINRYRRQLA